jgi:1-acyl-sn-glycerol-3-phosphate acyltransferase
MGLVNIPEIGGSIPRRGNALGRVLGRGILSVARWSFAGTIPDLSKAAIIVAPHTSNWDFLFAASAMFALDLDLRFLGKHTLFHGPVGWFMRSLGGIPVDRSQPGTGVVEEMIELFGSSQQLLLALAPEGTRGRVDRWKTGFHNIALGAGVPIIPVSLGYGRRLIHLGAPYQPTEDLKSDLARLREFFADVVGRRTELQGKPEAVDS